MNKDQIVGNWRQVKGKAKEQWGKLTDDDLDVIDGRREALVGKIQACYGKARNEAEKEVDDFLNHTNNLAGSNAQESRFKVRG